MKSYLKKTVSMLLAGAMAFSCFSTNALHAEVNHEILLASQQISGKSASGHEASLAIDGDMTTYYLSPALTTEIDHMRYVDITLDGIYDLSELKLYQLEGNYYHYQIYASETGTSFNKVAYKDDNKVATSEGDSIVFETPVKAAKLRISLSYNSAGQQANLVEVRLFGEKVAEFTDSSSTFVPVENFEGSKWQEEWNHFESDKAYANAKTIQEMHNLVGRVIGEEWKDDFIFEVKEYPSSNDTFEIEQGDNGKIIIRGNNGIAMASGFNHYLKYYCNVMYDPLFVSHLTMPQELPAVEKSIIKETQYDVRYALNFCTYSYTMAFWDWGEYEAFLDWAAMSGMNLILDIVGQEEIVRRLLSEYGYTHDEIKEYIVGPGYFAWYYMQNMTSWGGPLPDNWFEERVELGRKMHDRMQTYGIRPVLSGFSGMVPLDFDQRFSDATTVPQGNWSEFARPDMLRVYVSEGKKDYFDELADVYYNAQKDVFGEITHYYAVDPFHEGGKTGDMDLPTVYKTVQNKMLEHDPEGIWVIQQWAGRLTDNKVKGLVNKENALILDLSSEYASYANVMENNQVPWVWNMLHAFGGKPGLEANVHAISQVIPQAFDKYDYMAGIGVTPESFSRCPMIYDMLWEMTWTKDPIDPMKWGMNYLERRYGAVNDDLKEAWSVLLQTIYDCRINDIAGSLINVRPREKFTSTSGGGRTNITYDAKQFEEVLKLYLDNYEYFKDSEAFVYDLADVARQVLQNSSLEFHKRLLNAYYAGDKASFNVYADKFLELIALQNDILATSDSFQAGTWIEQARTMLAGADDWTKDLFEFNARCLVTTWGGQRTDLVDYSYRAWSGLTQDYYLKRWTMWVENYRESLMNDTGLASMNFFSTEWEWVNRKSDEGYAYPTTSTTKGSLYTLASQAYDSYSLTSLDKLGNEIESNATMNLLEGKLFATTNSINADNLKLLTDGDAGTGWVGQTSDWPVVLTYEFDNIVNVEEINIALKSLVVGGLSVTYKIEVFQNDAWKVLSEDASGNIGGQIDLTCNESIKQIRCTFDSIGEGEVPEIREISVFGTEDKIEYVNAAKGLTATSTSNLERPISYLTDEDLTTVWFANNGNSKATVTLPLGIEQHVEILELHFEKAGLRFLFDVYGKKADGSEELLFSKGATNADMPSRYQIPVDKDLTEIRIQYNGRDTGGQFYGAAFGFAEIKVLKLPDTHVNVVQGMQPTVSSAFSDRPAVCLTDGDLKTYWLTNGNNPAQVTLPLKETTYVDQVEIYMEKAGMRFIFDIYATNENGEEELIFTKGATNADMPDKYIIPVNKTIQSLRVDYKGRDTGGQYSKAGFGFAEIRVIAPITVQEDDFVIENIAGNAIATSLNVNTNEIADAYEIIDGDLASRKEYVGADYTFVPVVYTVDLVQPSFVESFTTYFEKAGLRFKFKMEVEKADGTRTTVLDMLNNAGDMKASYNVVVDDTIQKVIISVLDRCKDGSFYAASNMIYEVEVMGKVNSIGNSANVTVGDETIDVLTDDNKETSVKLAENKTINFKFDKYCDLSSFNIFAEANQAPLQFVISYLDEAGNWQVASEQNANLTARTKYEVTLKDVILTNEVRLEILNEDAITLSEVEIFENSNVKDLRKCIILLEGLTSTMKFDPYAGGYDKAAYDQFMEMLNEVKLNSSQYNSKEISVITAELKTAYNNLKMTYLEINRADLLKALLDAKVLVANEHLANREALQEAIISSEAVYDTYKVTQAKIDDATFALNQAMDATIYPTNVQNLIATSKDYKTIQLTWDASMNTDTYLVERLSGEEWMTLAETTEPTYTHAGVKTGKTYTYRITAKKADMVSEPTQIEASAQLSGEVELSIAPNGTTKFDLTWTAVDGATRYIVYRKSSDSEWKKILTLGKDARSYTSKDMKPNTYQYMVKAARYDSVERVQTNGSNIVEGIVGAEEMSPTNAKVEVVDGVVVLTWDKVATMSHYEIYRSKDGGAYRHVKTTNTNTLTNTTLKAGSTYSYKIRAYVVVNGEKVYAPVVITNSVTLQ